MRREGNSKLRWNKEKQCIEKEAAPVAETPADNRCTYCGRPTETKMWLHPDCMNRYNLSERKLLRAEAAPVVETPAENTRLSTMLYRSLERLSIAIESCAKIGFEESKPTTNEQHAQVWIALNEAQKDAKLKLKHYAELVRAEAARSSGAPRGFVDKLRTLEANVRLASHGGNLHSKDASWIADRLREMQYELLAAAPPAGEGSQK